VALAAAHVFRPRPQPAHMAALLAAFLLHLPLPTLHRLRFKLLLCGVGLGVPGVLMPVMAHLWLRARAGNANYLFFQGYVWNVFWSLLVLEMALALLKLDEMDDPDGGGGGGGDCGGGGKAKKSKRGERGGGTRSHLMPIIS
jgi:hypothetical protein